MTNGPKFAVSSHHLALTTSDGVTIRATRDDSAWTDNPDTQPIHLSMTRQAGTAVWGVNGSFPGINEADGLHDFCVHMLAWIYGRRPSDILERLQSK